MRRLKSLLRHATVVGFILSVLVVALLAAPKDVFAQSFDITGISTIESQANGWFTIAQGWAMKTYTALFVIELTMLGVQGVLFRDNLGEFMASATLKVFTAGFFMWLIVNAGPFFHGVVNGLRDAGQQLGTDQSGVVTVTLMGLGSAALLLGAASGGHLTDIATSLTPNLFVGTGPTGVGNSASQGHMLFSFFMSSIAFMVVMSMAGIVIQYAMITIESYIVMGAGVLYLGFSGTKFTMPFAQGYMSYAMNVGTKLFTFYLLLGAVQPLLGNAAVWSGAALAAAALPFGPSAELAILPAAIGAFQLVLAATLLAAVPNFAGSFLSGNSSLGSGAFIGQFTGAMSSLGQMRAGLAQMSRGNDDRHALQHLKQASEHTGHSYQGTGQPNLPGVAGAQNDNMAPGGAVQTQLANPGSDSSQTADTSVGKQDSIAHNASRPPITTGTTVNLPAQQRGIPATAGTPAAGSGASPWPSTRISHAAAVDNATYGGGGNRYADYTTTSSPIIGPDGKPIPALASSGSGGRMIDENEDLSRYNDAELGKVLEDTPYSRLSRLQREYLEEHRLPVMERAYKNDLFRQQQNEATGMFYAAQAVRGMTPPPDAPVGGVQIRLNNPDRL